jgi:hypothetical protein
MTIAESSLGSIPELAEVPLHRIRRQIYALTAASQPVKNGAQSKNNQMTEKNFQRATQVLVEQFPQLVQQAVIAKEYIRTGRLAHPPYLGTAESQTLWGLTCAYCFINHEKIRQDWKKTKEQENFHQSQLWKALVENPQTVTELRRAAVYASSYPNNPNTVLQWGQPQTWFWFLPEKNLINIDLMYTLICGFEHTRATIFHEIAHSEEDTTLTPLTQKIRERIVTLEKEARESEKGLEPQDYIEYCAAVTLFKLKQSVDNTLLDLPANEFASHTAETRSLPQDIRYSNNVFEFYLSARIAIPQNERIADDMPEIEPAPEQSGSAKTDKILALIANQTEQPGHPSNADPSKANQETVAAARRFENRQRQILMTSFQQNGLYENTETGWRSVGLSTPLPTDYQLAASLVDPKTGIATMIPECRLSRRDLSLAHVVRNESENLRKNRYAIIDRVWENWFAKDAEEIIRAAKEKTKNDLENKKGNQDQADEGIRVSLAGNTVTLPQQEMPGPASASCPNQQHQETMDQAAQEAKATIPDDRNPDKKNPTRGTLENLRQQQAKEDRAKEEAKIREENDRNRAAQNAAAAARAAANRSGAWIDQLPIGDLSKYRERIRDWQPAITHLANLLQNMVKKQMQNVPERSTNHTIIPERGNWNRFRPQRHQTLREKQMGGQHITIEDVKRCRQDIPTPRPTKVGVVLKIDGSGSMAGEPIQKALQTALIIYESAKYVCDPKDRQRSLLDVHIIIWGPENPPVLASPNDFPDEIEKRLQGVLEKNGLGTGTQLTPAIIQTARLLAEKTPKTTSTELYGCSHVITVSDGDIADPENAKTSLEIFLGNNHRTTYDIALINPSNHPTEIAKVTEARTAKWQKVGLITETEPQTAASSLINEIYGKLDRYRSFVSPIPTSLKVNQARNALARLTRQEKENHPSTTAQLNAPR